MDVPKDVSWPSIDTLSHFVDIYDWDRLILHPDTDNILRVRLVICAGPLPCALSLLGASNEGSSLKRVGNGSFACLQRFGCSEILISKVRILCAESNSGLLAPLEIEGAVLELDSSSVVGCISETDGGSVRAYGGAIVQVRTVDLSF